MTRRMFDSRLWANYRFGQMPLMARMLLLGIINHADDQGRMMARPIYLRTEIFRYDTDITDDKVSECLKLIEANGTIELYESDGKEYLQLKNWWDYQSLQFAAPSNMPRPKEWTDRVRYNAKGGGTLTCNWLTPQGKKLDDTCDQDGNALPIVATLSPRNPGGRPPQNQPEKPPVNGHGNPGGNTNKDQIKINTNEDQGGDPRAQEPAVSPPTNPPPAYRSQPEPNEYIPGVRRPPQNQAKRNCDHFMTQAAKHNIGPEPFRLMVDAVLQATGKLAIANTSGEYGQKVLNQAKETVVSLLEIRPRTVEDVEAIFVSWRENDYRGASPPTFEQILDHASAMDAGTHITKRSQDTSKKDFASFKDYDQWAERHDPQHRRIAEGIVIKNTFVKRANYQPARTH